MTDGREDELLERLRRANPAADGPERASSDARADVLALAPRHRSRLHLRRRPTDIRDEPLGAALRTANPSPAATADVRADMHSSELLASLLSGAVQRRRRRAIRNHRGLAVIIVAATCLAGSAFGYVFAQRNVTSSAIVRCFSGDSLGSRSVGITVGSAGAIGTCRDAVWSKGGFHAPRTPPLVGCVLADGAEGIFPGRNAATCTRLDLSAALPPTTAALRVAELQRLLIAGLDPDDRCLPTSAARRVALADLSRTGVTGWSIQIGVGASENRPCTQAFISSSSRVIELLPFPRLVDHRPVATTGPGT